MAQMIVALVSSLVFAQATVELCGAEVSGKEVSAATMEVDVAVTLAGSSGPLVVHLFLPGEPEQVRPLVERAGGRWGAILELRRADWHVVFEDVASGTLSPEASLTELGLDSALLGLGPRADQTRPESVDSLSGSWLWLALAVIAVASALVVMLLGRRTVRPRHLRR